MGKGRELGAVNTVGAEFGPLTVPAFFYFYGKVSTHEPKVRSRGLGGDVGAECGMEEAASSSRAVERWHPVARHAQNLPAILLPATPPPAPRPGTVLRGPISLDLDPCGSGKPVLTVTG